MTTRSLNRSAASIRIYCDPGELALKAARHFARLADQYVLGCGRFTVALSGGSTPRADVGAPGRRAISRDRPLVIHLFLLGR